MHTRVCIASYTLVEQIINGWTNDIRNISMYHCAVLGCELVDIDDARCISVKWKQGGQSYVAWLFKVSHILEEVYYTAIYMSIFIQKGNRL